MIEQLKTIFEESAKAGTGRLCVGFKDLVTGEEAYYNGDTVFPTASVYKTFVLCELFRREKEGTFSFSDTHTLLESDKSIGSGILELIGEGAVLSMMDYAVLMMAISDNTAADYLYQLVGPKAIHENVFQPLGMTNSLCNTEGRSLLNAYYGVTVEEYRRKDAAGERFHARNGSYFRCEEPKNKQTTPADMIKLLSALYSGTFTDPETDQRILDVMHKCQSKLQMPAKLPAGVRIAHKTGSIDHLANDCGIVYTDCGNYALAMSYNGNLASEDEYEGTSGVAKGAQILGQLSADIYRVFTQHHKQ